MQSKNIHIFKDLKEISQFVAWKWKKETSSAIRNNGRFNVALSGGRSPVKIYQHLASLKETLPWNKTHIFMVDERLVPFDSPDSNFGMINEKIIKPVFLPKENAHPISICDNTETSAEPYENSIREYFAIRNGEIPVFDFVMLGIGEDGHTTSLFPKHDALREKKRLAVSVEYAQAKHKRIGLTLPVINNARVIIMLMTGENKTEAIKGVLSRTNNDLPASLVKPMHGDLYYLLDEEAAARLSADIPI